MGGDTGNSLQSTIGRHFQEILKQSFPILTDPNDKRNVPDLVGEGFHIEAKVGYMGNGPHVHDFQWLRDELAEPVYYAFGYHNLAGVKKSMGHYKTERGRQNFLERNMVVPHIFFLPLLVVKSIYDTDKRKGPAGRSHDLVMSKSTPKRLIAGEQITRDNGSFIGLPSERYGFNPKEYEMQPIRPVGECGFSVGYMAHKDDAAVLSFLQSIK